MGSKRRYYQHSHRHPRNDDRLTRHSVSDDTKRRRLSSDTYDAGHDFSSPQKSLSNVGSNEDDGWTLVSAKSTKKHSRDRSDGKSPPDDYPALRTNHNHQSVIGLKDIRDLALYVLADEIAPKWTAVSNSKNVRKVVVLMVPGLDETLLKRAEQRSSQQVQSLAKDEDRSSTQSSVSNESTRNRAPSAGLRIKLACHPVSEDQQPDHHDSQEWLFRNIHRVRAPGDARMNKVHSPLQAMLLSQEPSAKRQPGTSNRNAFTADRTPITDFIHSADDLREAEYPVHPATFTVQLDADFEAERRQKTGQTSKEGWVDTDVLEPQPRIDSNAQDWVSKGLTIYSLDCEMVQTADDAYSLARISLIQYPDGKVVMDEYVKPDLPITNYHTQYSGITPQILENVTTTLQDVQQELLKILTPSTVLLGHSLDSDLNALKLTHPFIIDTSIIFPHPRGLPLRSSLKYLANKYLKREIQMGGEKGHNSVEDAKAVLDLVKLKCEKGAKYGTIEANGEPIFRRLKRNGRTSAMVEYGTPERGYGKDATYTIGGQNDDEITKGVIRAIKGDDYFEFDIPMGGADFVWGRLRALEFARGWVNGSSTQFHQNGQQASTNYESKGEAKTEDINESLDDISAEMIERIQQIYDALPTRSMLIVFSGTGDMRPVIRLQAQQQQYRKEFKVKKWDELTVKWTDTEEQALKKACEDARAGWAVCTIK